MERHPSSSFYSSSSSDLPAPKQEVESETPDQALQYATNEMVLASLFPTSNGISDNWKYSLEIAQQPIRARMCGFGEKDRRSISPLPFVKLRVTDDGGEPVDIDALDPGFFILHASLYQQKNNQEASLVMHPTSSTSMTQQQSGTKNLVGNSCIQGKRLKDLRGQWGIWFVFQDMSIRTDGDFYLTFALTYLGCMGQINTEGNAPMEVLATIDCNPFRVYSAKKFPGMIDTTPLSRCFGEQGIKIPTRSDKKKKRTYAEYRLSQNPYPDYL